ncbi:MAG TPA: hypothetical protein V6C81_06405 [Planktothrix sp.]
MSNARKGDATGQLIVVQTSTLKERLNTVYKTRGGKGEPKSFANLWDLKELALLEGKDSIEVPKPWLEELDTVLQSSRKA